MRLSFAVLPSSRTNTLLHGLLLRAAVVRGFYCSMQSVYAGSKAVLVLSVLLSCYSFLGIFNMSLIQALLFNVKKSLLIRSFPATNALVGKT